MDKNDQRIEVYLKKIIDTLPTKNDDQLRELFLILQRMELNDDYEGELFNICVDAWEKIGKKPSVRYNAFKLIVKIAKKQVLHALPVVPEGLAFETKKIALNENQKKNTSN